MSGPVMIPVAKPLLGEAEAEAARRVILSGWVTQGPEVAAFESEFATYVGAAHACAVSNCTSALHLALLAVGAGPGDEVITVSHSFIATANAVVYCGATPVFVDIEGQGFNIDPALVEAAITHRTKAILCVHQLGMPCNLERIVDIANRHMLPVIEDAACAIGSEINWRGRWEKIGKPHGDIAVFSFHPRKVITTGDGGMITTVHPDYDEKFRLWRQHGMNIPDTVRHGSPQVMHERYPELGFNYRMTDIQAAVGREQLKRLDDIVIVRRLLADRYCERLQSVAGVTLPPEPSWAKSNWQSFCVRLALGIDQRTVMQAMLDRGISTRRGVMNSHLEDPYALSGVNPYVKLGHSELAQSQSIMLPLYAQMTNAEVDRVVDELEAAIGHHTAWIVEPAPLLHQVPSHVV